jgi:hypothetical protein
MCGVEYIFKIGIEIQSPEQHEITEQEFRWFKLIWLIKNNGGK